MQFPANGPLSSLSLKTDPALAKGPLKQRSRHTYVIRKAGQDPQRMQLDFKDVQKEGEIDWQTDTKKRAICSLTMVLLHSLHILEATGKLHKC